MKKSLRQKLQPRPIHQRLLRFPAAAILLLLTAGCGGFIEELAKSLVPDIILIDDKTALENQVLGTYEKIDRRLVVEGSARAVSVEDVRNRAATENEEAAGIETRKSGEEGRKARERVSFLWTATSGTLSWRTRGVDTRCCGSSI